MHKVYEGTLTTLSLDIFYIWDLDNSTKFICPQYYKGELIKHIRINVSDLYIRGYYKIVFLYGGWIKTKYKHKGDDFIVTDFRELLLKDFIPNIPFTTNALDNKVFYFKIESIK